MASLNAERSTDAPRRSTDERWLALGLVTALAALALVRIAIGGWAPLAPDDARYLYVGLSILDGRGPVTPGGDVFVLRSPVYGLSLAIGSAVAGGDPLIGARVVALALTLLGMVGALRLGWLLGGPGGAIGTAVALAATPLVWQLVPSLRIDLPQTAVVIATLLVVWRPSARRWAVGGVMLGIAILIKETALPLVILPIALLGTEPAHRLVRLAALFVGAAVLTAAWWWIVVWLATGQLFPLNALSIIEARDVAGALRLHRAAFPLVAAIGVGWTILAWRARSDVDARRVLVTAAALVPAAVYATSLGLNARNLAGLAVLSAVAAGAGGAWLVARLRPVATGGAPGRTRALATIGLAGMALFAVVSPAIGQRDIGQVRTERLADDLAAWLAAEVPDGGRVVMAFREREEMALRRFGRTEVAVLPVNRVDPAVPPETYVWMGLRDRQLFGYRRTAWVAALTDLGTDALVLVSPHPFTPASLTAGPIAAGRLGLTRAATLHASRDRADIFRVDAAVAAATTKDVPLHLTAAAADAWLDLAGGETAVERLLAARPVVTGDGEQVAALLQRLGADACSEPDEAGAIRIGPAGSCPG